MSLAGMKRGFEKHGPIYGGILAFLMIAGIVFTGFGANVSPQTGGMDAATGRVVAKVGEAEVTDTELNARLQELLNQQAMFGGAVTNPADKAKFRAMVLNGIKQEQAVIAAAKKAGVTVNDGDIAKKRDEIWEQARSQFAQSLELKEDATDAQINRALAEQAPGMTVQRLKTERLPEDRVRLQLYQEGLANALKAQMSVSEEDVKKSYNEIKVRHILIKSGEGGLPEPQAKAKADKVLKEVLASPDKMAELAKQYSDDPGSKNNGGIYDWAPGAQYVPEFTKGALAAGVGKVNPEPIKTPYGYHIIKLEGERPGKDFPKDWDKEKQKYIDQYKEQIANQKVMEAINAETEKVAVELTDPLLKGARLVEEAQFATDDAQRTAKLEEAVTELAKVKKEDDLEGAAPLLKAEAYQKLKKTDEAIAAYTEALEAGNTAEVRLALAQLYLEKKDKENALKQVDEAEKLAIPNVQLQMQLAMVLNQAGEEERYKKAMDKANEMMKRMAAQQAQQQMQLPQGAPPASSAPPAPPAGDSPTGGTAGSTGSSETAPKN
ncbi:MAG: hypothetical protein OHK0029_04260 [Armatimonadaceae bacterium]